jgi:hypothetical protein
MEFNAEALTLRKLIAYRGKLANWLSIFLLFVICLINCYRKAIVAIEEDCLAISA